MEQILIIRGVERILIVLAATLCIYLGYLLFIKGVSGQASLKAQVDRSKLQVVNAAPGIFFAIFGAAILCVMVFHVVIVSGPETNYRFWFSPKGVEESATPQSNTGQATPGKSAGEMIDADRQLKNLSKDPAQLSHAPDREKTPVQ